jgi:uncharacterized damage-inducible protein DinB
MTADDFAAAVMEESARELEEALGRIEHCLAQLSEEQVWWDPREGLNSIANLLLHLAGNLRQWIVAGLGGAEDHRDRPAEFAARGSLSKAELLGRLRETVAESCRVLRGQSAAELLRVRRIQGFDVTGLTALLHTVPHFRGHTQEIIHRTRFQLGPAYRMAWQPATAEQGAGP